MILVKICAILVVTVSIATGLNVAETYNNDTSSIYVKSASELRVVPTFKITESDSQDGIAKEGRNIAFFSKIFSPKLVPKSQFLFTDVLADKIIPDWKYDDQVNWIKLYPLCTGLQQSPINIRNRYIRDRLTSTCFKWQNYDIPHTGLAVTKIDNTVDVTAQFIPLPLLSGGPLTGDYRLSSIRWHWGFDDNDGSEHAINSQKYPLEMHAIHYNTKYAGLAQALASTNDPEAIAIVAVLYSISHKSSASSAYLTNAIAKIPAFTDPIILNQLGLGFQKNYYTYLGSLTAPPCSPIVRWIVSGTIQRIRPLQMAVFRNLRVGNVKLIDTFRELQPIGARTVDHYNKC